MKLNSIALTLVAIAGVATAQAVPELEITVGAPGYGSTTYDVSGTQTGNNGTAFSFTAPNGIVLNLTAIEIGSVGGTSAAPTFDLDAVETSYTAGVAGSIVITLSDNDFGPTNAGAIAGYGGNVEPTGSGLTSSVSMATYYSDSNALFAETNLIASSPLTAYTGAHVGSSGLISSGSGQYSLTEVLTIAGSGTGTVSVDSGLSTVPDGATTALLVGAGLLGLGLVASRRKLTLA